MSKSCIHFPCTMAIVTHTDSIFVVHKVCVLRGEVTQVSDQGLALPPQSQTVFTGEEPLNWSHRSEDTEVNLNLHSLHFTNNLKPSEPSELAILSLFLSHHSVFSATPLLSLALVFSFFIIFIPIPLFQISPYSSLTLSPNVQIGRASCRERV